MEVPQWSTAEIEEASSGQQVAKLHQEELLARAGDFLNSFGDVQESQAPRVYKSTGVPAFASFGAGPLQGVQVRRNPDRTVRRLVPQGGHNLPPTAPVAPRASSSRSAAGRKQRNRKRFGSSFPEEDWDLMRAILDKCEFPSRHRFKTCGECGPCTMTSCTPATMGKCKACSKKWLNGGVGRSRHACERRVGCSRWTIKRCDGCRFEEIDHVF